MTIINASLLDDFGILACDTAVYRPTEDYNPAAIDPSSPDYHGEIESQTFSGHDETRDEPEILCHISKIAIIPQLNMAVAGAGDMGFFFRLKECLSTAFYDDFLDFVEQGPGFVSGVYQAFTKDSTFMGVAIGYSEREKRIHGYQFSSHDSFQFQHLAFVERHISHPLAKIDWKDPDFRACRWATDQDALERLHVNMAKNQHQLYRAGKYKPGFCCGGQLHMAIVEPDRVSVKTICRDIASY